MALSISLWSVRGARGSVDRKPREQLDLLFLELFERDVLVLELLVDLLDQLEQLGGGELLVLIAHQRCDFIGIDRGIGILRRRRHTIDALVALCSCLRLLGAVSLQLFKTRSLYAHLGLPSHDFSQSETSCGSHEHDEAAGEVAGGPVTREVSDDSDVLGFFALATRRSVELDLLALFERLVAAALDVGVVDEDVVLLLTCDETEALFSIEELHSACCQRTLSSTCVAPCLTTTADSLGGPTAERPVGVRSSWSDRPERLPQTPDGAVQIAGRQGREAHSHSVARGVVGGERRARHEGHAGVERTVEQVRRGRPVAQPRPQEHAPVGSACLDPIADQFLDRIDQRGGPAAVARADPFEMVRHERRIAQHVGGEDLVERARVQVGGLLLLPEVGEKFSDETEISIRPSSPLQFQTGSGVMNGNSTQRININTAGFLAGSTDYQLVISRNPALELGKQLKMIFNYS